MVIALDHEQQCCISSASSYMEQDHGELYDNTCNGQCSQCGGCCGVFLPVTKQELKDIKRYVKRHHIREQYHNNFPRCNDTIIDMTCPFRDNDKRICTIYPVRPFICREFICSMDQVTWAMQHMNKVHGNFRVVNLRAEFFKVDDREKLLAELLHQQVTEEASGSIKQKVRRVLLNQ